jgi:GDP-D-mannose dehydratase
MSEKQITGVTGQDGAYLAELLLSKGLRGPRHQAPRVLFNTAASITSTRTRTSETCASSCTTAT